jgi:ankyrin repeat protein
MEGVDRNAKTNRGFTPMLVAAWKGELAIVQKLITKGADIKAVDSAGRNVWGVAHDWHKEEILELLKRHDFHYSTGDVLAFPPHPKWRPENRDKM